MPVPIDAPGHTPPLAPVESLTSVGDERQRQTEDVQSVTEIRDPSGILSKRYDYL